MKRTIALLLSVLLIVACLVGCTSSVSELGAETETVATETATATAEATATEAATETAAEDPDAWKYGGIMVMRVSTDVIQPNFLWYSSTTEGILRDLIYDKLFTVDADMNIVPRLALSYEASDDNKTYIVHLREGVKWSDGEDFNADDVVFYFDYYDKVTTTLKDNNYAEDYGLVVTKIDDYTVKYELDKPINTFPYTDLCQYAFLPEHIWKDVDPATFDSITDLKYLVGMGPFAITEMKAGEEIVLERNNYYWDGTPYLDGVVVRVLSDSESTMLAFENGEINFYRGSKTLADRLEGQDGFSFVSHPSGNITPIFLNNNDAILSDVNVRHALSLLLNREAYLTAANSEAELMTSVFSMADIGYEANTAVEDLSTYDPDKAAQILDEAGWVMGADGIREKDGQKLSLVITSTTDASTAQLIWIDACKTAGIELTVKVVDKATRNAEVFSDNPTYQIFFNGCTLGPTVDGYRGFYSLGTYTTYVNAEVEQLFDDANAAPTIEDAKPIYAEISKKVSSDYPMIWVSDNVKYWCSSAYLNTDDCGLNGGYCGWVSISKAYFEQ